MCNNTDSIKQNSKTEQNQQQEGHKLTIGETAQVFGNAMVDNAINPKDSMVDMANEVRDSAVERTNEIRDKVVDVNNRLKEGAIEKTNSSRTFAANKVGSLKDTIEPPKEEPEPKSIGDKIGDVGSAIRDQAKALTSNFQPHPDEKAALDSMKEEKTEESSRPAGVIIQDYAQEAKKNMDQFGADTKQMAEASADSARSWTATQLGNLQTTIEPEKQENTPPSLGDRLNDAGSTAASTFGDIQKNIHTKLEEIRAGNDPHDDPKLRGENKPL